MRLSTSLLAILIAVALWPVRSHAATQEDFLVRTTQDLVDLCSANQNDPLRDAAIHFCNGYLVGAYQFYRASVAAQRLQPLVCPPDPPPSRNEGVQKFVSWGQANPQYMNEPPIDGFFRFLVMTWPCRR